jgi:hypothetical protein
MANGIALSYWKKLNIIKEARNVRIEQKNPD